MLLKGAVTTQELSIAMALWIKVVQGQAFSLEIQQLSRKDTYSHPRRPRGSEWGREKFERARKNFGQRKFKNENKSPWGQGFNGPVPNGRSSSGF